MLNDFIFKANLIHGTNFCYDLVNYTNNKNNVDIICYIHGIFKQSPKAHTVQKQGCPKCKKNYKLDNKTFIQKANIVHNNKYDYSLVDYVNAKTKVKIICNIHGVYEQNPYNHIGKKYGCPKCANNKKLTKEEFIIKANNIHNSLYNYNEIEYVNSNTKIKIYCLKCEKYYYQTPNSHLCGESGCPKCKLSKGELKIKKILSEKNIAYIQQHKFENCRYKKHLIFDFYLPEYNTCIEYDGIQHFSVRSYWEGNENELLKIQKRDKIKNEFCESNKIRLIRIKYTEYKNIEKIISKI